MNIKTYVAQPTGDTEFSFLSQGRNGCFEIRTCFEIIDDNLFNLAFGPWDEDLMGINDRQELRNGDMDIILATVAHIAIKFLETHPKASIYATGLTLPGKLSVRTRKYQMGIRSHLAYITEKHNVYGFKEFAAILPGIVEPWQLERRGNWEVFSPNTNYDAFLLNLK